MNQGNIQPNPADKNPQGLGILNFNEVSEPGIYLDIQRKRIFRIPSEVLDPNHAGTRMTCLPDFQVVKISSDPRLEKTEIRKLCIAKNLPIPE